MIDRLVLGTASFAIPGYRLSGKPMPTRAEACAILEAAWDAGVRYFDTASAYGNGLAESILGETGIPSRDGACIITKIAPGVTPEQIKPAYQASAERLGAEPWAVLLHAEKAQHSSRMREALAMFSMLMTAAPAVGVSVYDPAEAAFAATWGADVIQYPGNTWDRAIRLPHYAGIKQVRSIFLRGRLLQAYTLETCLRYAFEATNADLVTVGVGDMAQLREILAVLRQPTWWQRLDESNRDRPREVMPSVTGAQG